MHGYPDSKEVRSEVAPRPAGHFHVVAHDIRGHGRSTAPRLSRGGSTLEKPTDDFLAVADAVGPDEPVPLVRHDWGSVQAGEFVTVGRAEGRTASFTSMPGPSLNPFGTGSTAGCGASSAPGRPAAGPTGPLRCG
ncbi:Haloalkane dehalogenase [Streptomyces sp. AVP053U2]|nr:Haloalkane dehalogenase [Streptomyces sp. AVP053U2]